MLRRKRASSGKSNSSASSPGLGKEKKGLQNLARKEIARGRKEWRGGHPL